VTIHKGGQMAKRTKSSQRSGRSVTSHTSGSPGPKQTSWTDKALASYLYVFFCAAPLFFLSKFDSASGKLISSHYTWPKFYLILSGSFFLMSGYCFKLAIDSKWRQDASNFLRHNRFIWLLGGWLLLIALSTCKALIKPAAGLILVDYLALSGTCFVLFHLFHHALFRRSALGGLCTAIAGTILLGILQYCKITQNLFVPITQGKLFSLGSTFAGNTVFSHFLVTSYPFLLLELYHSWIKRKTSSSRFFLPVMIGLVFTTLGLPILLILSGSRTGILVGFMELVIVMLVAIQLSFKSQPDTPKKQQRPAQRERKKFPSLGKNRKLLIVLCAGLLFLGSMAGSFFLLSRNGNKVPKDPFQRITYYRLHKTQRYLKKLLSGELSFQTVFGGRYPPWCNTIFMIKDHPLLGVGPGNWQFQYPFYHNKCPKAQKSFNYSKRMYRTHNDYLQITAESGIPAGLLFLFIWLRQFYLLLRKQSSFPEDGSLRFALGLSMFAFSIVMLVSFPMQRPYGRFFFFFLLALGEARASSVFASAEAPKA